MPPPEQESTRLEENGLLDIVFWWDAGQTAPHPTPVLNADWEKLETRIFVIICTIMYAFKIFKMIFADIIVFLMTLSNIDSTSGRSREIQYSVNF